MPQWIGKNVEKKPGNTGAEKQEGAPGHNKPDPISGRVGKNGNQGDIQDSGGKKWKASTEQVKKTERGRYGEPDKE